MLNSDQLLTLIGTCFMPNMKALGILDLDFLPKTSKTLNGRSRRIFELHPPNLMRIHISVAYCYLVKKSAVLD